MEELKEEQEKQVKDYFDFILDKTMNNHTISMRIHSLGTAI